MSDTKVKEAEEQQQEQKQQEQEAQEPRESKEQAEEAEESTTEEEEKADREKQEEEEDSEMTNSKRIKYMEMKDNKPNERTALRPKMKLASFDDALPYVGDFGRYQLYLLVALLPYSVAYASLYFSQFFLTLVPREHWCKIDALLDVFTPAQRIEAAIPKTTTYPYYEACKRKDLNYSEIIRQGVPDPSSNVWVTNRTLGCESWEYNLTQIPYVSIGAELDWVCEQSYLISTAQAIFYCGSITGGFLFSWIADHRGRVPALILCAGCGLVASIATATTSSFWSFAICRFFTGLAFDNVINIPLIIVVEYMAVRRRSLVVNIAFGVYFAIGSTVLPWLAYYIANWRLFAFVSSLPLATCFITPWILPESARWYVSNGMSDKVVDKLKRIASVNKKKPESNFYETLYRNLNSSENKTESANLIDLFKTPRLARKTILLTAFWALTVMAFDGHVYSLKLLDSSVFVSFSLACATELPAGLLLALIIDRWGRRFCGFITMASTAVFSFAEIILDSGEARLAMSISSRFALNMAANVGLQYAAELMPTPVRAQGVGMIHIIGILAHSIAPYIVDTVQWWSDMPMLIITIVSFTCATIVLFLPETLGEEMPQTLQQGENFGKNQRFWSLPCIGTSYADSYNDEDNDDDVDSNYSSTRINNNRNGLKV